MLMWKNKIQQKQDFFFLNKYAKPYNVTMADYQLNTIS